MAWYFDVPKYCYEALIKISEEAFDEIIPYFQFLLMAIIKWTIRRPISDKLTKEEKEAYRERIGDVLKRVDNSIIMQQKNIDYTHKICALNLKYGMNILDRTSFDSNLFRFDDIDILSVKIINRLVVEKVESNEKRVRITGATHFGMFRDYISLGVVDKHSGEFFECDLFHRPEYDVYGIIDGKISEGTGYKVELPLIVGNVYMFALKNQEGKFIYPKVTIKSGLVKQLDEATLLSNKRGLVIFKNNKFVIKKCSLKNIKKYLFRGK